ncbi:Translin [Schizopora paradoxa]|uniref:Translin n=1 Tax=Schizopora paradoxa TaxID=27342 RepID=A0A0H2S8G1_9AGAM|nr:Translin [Schizopora paradoxa]
MASESGAHIANDKSITSHAAILHAFEEFRSDLDLENDRRERIVKSSRDITINSKRVIFLLHRLAIAGIDDDGVKDDRTDYVEAKKKLAEIRVIFKNLQHELEAERFWHHQSAISPGMQEYIEAVSFLHYLEKGKMISYDGVLNSLRDENGVLLCPLSLDDYLLGVSDLTGELMRFAITAISRRGGRRKAREVSDFVRGCKADFDGFSPYVKQLSKKQAVTSQSLQKIEEAAYAIAVRASEYGENDAMLADIVEQCVMGVKSRGAMYETETPLLGG